MKRDFVLLIIAGLALALVASCDMLSFSHTGREWTIAGGETIASDPLSVRRDVKLSVIGTLDSGTVTVSVLLDGSPRGDAVAIPAGSVDVARTYAASAGAWSFSATASADARGDLSLSIGDR